MDTLSSPTFLFIHQKDRKLSYGFISLVKKKHVMKIIMLSIDAIN